MQRRRSRPPAGERALSLTALSTLLWSGCAFTREGEHPLRAAPSAGGLYPLELYVVALDVATLERGLYHVDPFHQSLEQLDRSIDRDTVAGLLSDPHAAEHCACLVIVCSVMFRTRFKYGLRGYRFALIEAGHVAQNVLLMAAALDVAALPVGGFIDDEVNAAIGCDGLEEAPLYMLIVGGDGSAPE
jgi:SagB-type dehydrogenase family enzyme